MYVQVNIKSFVKHGLAAAIRLKIKQCAIFCLCLVSVLPACGSERGSLPKVCITQIASHPLLWGIFMKSYTAVYADWGDGDKVVVDATNRSFSLFGPKRSFKPIYTVCWSQVFCKTPLTI